MGNNTYLVIHKYGRYKSLFDYAKCPSLKVVIALYFRQLLAPRESFSEENWKKIYYLANGNGQEMRQLMPFMR